VQPRFLLPCFAVISVGLAALVPERGRLRAAGLALLALLAAGGAAAWMSPRTLAVALALAGAAAWIPAARVALPRPAAPRATLALALLAAVPAALAVESYRERVKADPARGYRADPVEGWGDVCLWVRASVAHARILYTGTIQMYPLYGPGLTNTLFWQRTDPRHDDVELLYRAALDHDADYVVSFSPVTLRYGALGERFKLGPSPLREMARRHPEAIEVVFAAGHADVARVVKPRRAAAPGDQRAGAL